MGATLRLAGVDFQAGGRKILSGIDAEFRAGRVSVLIGPSGCGKTTLLKCLTTSHRPTRGSVTVDGRDLWAERQKFRQGLGYVPQDDIVHPQLTVRQAFRYSARLRLDAGVTAEEISSRAEAIAKLLGLEERLGVRIRRLSGGQRKRVNIGIELLADPDVLILDEPASGLDPGTEEDLLRVLKRLADGGRTVVMTTHSMEFLDQVDEIVLLNAGRLAYAGALPGMLAHFRVAHAADVFKALR